MCVDGYVENICYRTTSSSGYGALFGASDFHRRQRQVDALGEDFDQIGIGFRRTLHVLDGADLLAQLVPVLGINLVFFFNISSAYRS